MTKEYKKDIGCTNLLYHKVKLNRTTRGARRGLHSVPFLLLLFASPHMSTGRRESEMGSEHLYLDPMHVYLRKQVQWNLPRVTMQRIITSCSLLEGKGNKATWHTYCHSNNIWFPVIKTCLFKEAV